VTLPFDANFSPVLVVLLREEYPGSAHVGLRSGTEAEIRDHAKANGFAIVSKDTDLRERSFVEGFPPKVLWLDVANAGTGPIAELPKAERARVERFGTSSDSSLLILSLGASAV